MPEALPTLSLPGGDPRGAPLVVEAGLGAEQQTPSCWNSLPSHLGLPALNENKVLVLDTDYEKYLLFCMENSAEPEQSLACQCLGGCRPCPGRPAVWSSLQQGAGGSGELDPQEEEGWRVPESRQERVVSYQDLVSCGPVCDWGRGADARAGRQVGCGTVTGATISMEPAVTANLTAFVTGEFQLFHRIRTQAQSHLSTITS